MVKSLMPRTLAIRIPAGHPAGGRRWQVPVMVDWFPPLTDEQLTANALATAKYQQPPYPNPNLLYVHVEVVDAPVTGRDLGDETDGVPV